MPPKKPDFRPPSSPTPPPSVATDLPPVPEAVSSPSLTLQSLTEHMAATVHFNESRFTAFEEAMAISRANHDAFLDRMKVLDSDFASKLSSLSSTVQTTVDRLNDHEVQLQNVKAEIHSAIQDELSNGTARVPFSQGINPLFPFLQCESKDFHVSKLTDRLKDLKLEGDTLRHLEVFYDSILAAFNATLRVNSAFPPYKQLPTNFDFYVHFCPNDPSLTKTDVDLLRRNFRAFSDSLRIFLLKDSTVSKDLCPESHLQLLPLRDECCGFYILSLFITRLSPQLGGKYRDFRKVIDSLQTFPGEHICEFYRRVKTLSNEIRLAKKDISGDEAALLERFLSLLRSLDSLQFWTVINPLWIRLERFKCDPLHQGKPLPFKYEEVLDALDHSGLTTIPDGPSSSLALPIPSLAAYADLVQPSSHSGPLVLTTAIGAYAGRHSVPPAPHPSLSSATQRLQLVQTKDGRRFIFPSARHRPSLDKHKCDLCANRHVNPWHVRERVMQYNALHGAHRKDFVRSQDSKCGDRRPQPAVLPASGKFASVSDSTEEGIPEAFFDSQQDLPATSDDECEIVDSTYFDIPVPPIGNLGSTAMGEGHDSSFFQDPILDPLQYRSFDA